MAIDPILRDEIYTLVGQEVASREFDPGAMARAVSEARGNRDQVEGLYIQFRFETLYRQAAAAEAKRRAEIAAGTTVVVCPHCGHSGRLIWEDRANPVATFLLLCLFIVPGIVYYFSEGFRGKCTKCKKTVAERSK